jgi:hypothetical protein
VSEIKKLSPLSDWLEFELDEKPDWLDTTQVKFKVRPITGFSGLNVKAGDMAASSVVAAMIIDAIEEWGFTAGGEPLACNSRTKQEYMGNLRQLLGLKVKDRPQLLGFALADWASDSRNFLKN